MGVALALLLTATGVGAEPGGACFQASDNRGLTFEVYQEAPPPVTETSANYAYWPATTVTTQNLSRMWLTRARVGQYYWQWANRKTEDVRNASGRVLTRKGNFQPGENGPLSQRTAFTTIDKANACTLAQTAAVLGQNAATRRYAAAGHVQIVGADAAGTDGIANAVDVCVIQARPMPPSAIGVLLDYEVQDGRTPDQTLRFLTEFAALAHGAGRKAFLLTNPLDAPTQVLTGVTADNAAALAGVFDRMTCFCGTVTPRAT
jgi:hypothetical protein